ncbi:hypothetical protein M422DRAFT_29727 [Sphaerobolus stellatus SS14]|uniref:Tubulin-tyrosine ligase n=1 Tax=Sphaerobolus stellatus (strain SS14) TaxID=990650 RepID=A0A0C9W3A1_SPHS4|nr:hypothetical protein M422DRAFT_29727 [Sphaerobolus stellatus SS14]
MLAVVSFPSAPLTESLVVNALRTLDPSIEIVQDVPPQPDSIDRLLQYSTYDKIDHELTHTRPRAVLASSYIIRKALIRKHFLSRCIASYVAKQPESVLKSAAPRTWDIDIAWADELDDFFADELWDLAKELDSDEDTWFILKAGMADRGNGIRLFNSRDALREIFEEFDEQSENESNEESTEQEIITSQLRHFVIQQYLDRPLLLDPSEVPASNSNPSNLKPYKFHLRAYCIASGALNVLLWSHILALFSGTPYSAPTHDENGNVNMHPHLTNTSFHTEHGEKGVRLLSELVDSTILSSPQRPKFTESDVAGIVDQVVQILRETFRAALASPVHFQSLPNAFELFGVDFLITHKPDDVEAFQVSLLEINSEPAIELTGPRLQWILRDMHESIARICVAPFFDIGEPSAENWKIGEKRDGFIKCSEEEVRGNDI